MEKKNESYSKGTILIILILFMFSSKLYNFFWDIGKSGIYVFLIIYFINYLNPNISKKIKEIFFDLINFGNNNIIKNILSKISSIIMNLFKKDTLNYNIETKKKKKKNFF